MAFKADPLKKKANFYSIKEASFRLPVEKDHPDAVHREYRNPKTEEQGVAHELAFKALYGVIFEVTFSENQLKDGTVLRSMHINLGDDDNGVAQVVSIPQDSRYATDFLKRLPSIDLSKEVRLMPYDFEKDGPRQVGLSVYQKGDSDEFTVKVDNNFFTKVEEKDGKKVYTNLHGFPEPTDDDASDWPFYFKKVSKFLIGYTKENILPNFTEEEKANEVMDKTLAAAIGSDPEAIPF